MLSEMFTEIAYAPDIDEEFLEKAKEIFGEYSRKNILVDCEFDDSKWIITDEYSRVGVNFQFEEFMYLRHYEYLFGMDLATFENHVKSYITTLLGQYSASSIRDFVNDIRRIISTNPEKIISGKADLPLFSVNMCLNFLYRIPNERNYELIESVEDRLAYKSSGQRSLAEFDTYFLFGDVLDDYWRSDLDDATRLFYYPLYLWWHITAIIPLRPREFLLMPRDCLSEKDDHHVITIRRNMLKGRRSGGIKYKIDEDYKKSELWITDTLASEIHRYIEMTDGFENAEIDTLLRADPHYRKWERSKSRNSRFYTMQNMYTCLRYFYAEVIEGIYRLKVVEKTAHIKDNEIGRINLGDTRHLAAINLMMEGGTPSQAMELAGHEGIEMASHYYSNITNLVECRTYRRYRRITGTDIQYSMTPISYLTLLDNGVPLSDGAKCFSSSFAKGEITDCLKAIGRNGEIGYCKRCSKYRDNGETYLDADEEYKERIKEDCHYLAEAFSLVRNGKGYEEDIGEAMLKLKASALSYSEYLIEKTSFEGEETWQEKQESTTTR